MAMRPLERSESCLAKNWSASPWMEVAGYSLAICHVMVCAAAGAAVKISATMSSPAEPRDIISTLAQLRGAPTVSCPGAQTPAELIRLGAPGEEVDAPGGHDHLAVLVRHFHERADDPAVRLAPRRRRLENGQSAAQGVARAHGREPLQLGDARASEPDRVLEKPVVEETHEHATRVPAARDEAAPDRALGRRLVRVERLRIELAGEGEDGLLRHRAAPELDDLARLDVLPVAHGLQADGLPRRSARCFSVARTLAWRPAFMN